MKTLTEQQVQDKLKSIPFYSTFTVQFQKKDGSIREMTVYMEPPVSGQAKVTSAVAVKEKNTGLWKAFRTDSVLSID